MPNWCEGWVKFRGSRENLEKFIRGEFNGAEPELSCGDLLANIPDKYIFLNSLRRAYVECNNDYDDCIYLNDDDVGIFAIKIKNAWSTIGQGYDNLAKKYKLDIKGKCYERVMEFIEEFEYNSNGDEILYKVYEFTNYQWECECPTLGG